MNSFVFFLSLQKLCRFVQLHVRVYIHVCIMLLDLRVGGAGVSSVLQFVLTPHPAAVLSFANSWGVRLSGRVYNGLQPRVCAPAFRSQPHRVVWPTVDHSLPRADACSETTQAYHLVSLHSPLQAKTPAKSVCLRPLSFHAKLSRDYCTHAQ